MRGPCQNPLDNVRQKPYHGGGPDALGGLPKRGGSGHEARHEHTSRRPAGPQTPSQEALALHREGKHELAMQRYVAILQQNPGNVDALYYVAMLAIQQGQIAEGLKVIARALEVEPTAGAAAQSQGPGASAAEPGRRRAAKLRPRHRGRSGIRRRLRQPRHAACRRWAARRRRSPTSTARWRCGRTTPRTIATARRALADLGRLDEALAGFDRAIALMPAMAPAYFNRADVLLRIGRPADALRDCDQAIALYPELAGAHCTRGLALKALGRLDEAKVSFKRAGELDPQFAGLASAN